VVLGGWLDLMVLEVFSNLNESMILSGIGWMVALTKSCGQRLGVQVETSDEWHSSGAGIGTSAV